MLETYLKIAWRNAIKNRSFTLICISSLVLGITLFFFISIWVKEEMAYDTHFSEPQQLARVEMMLTTPEGNTGPMATVGAPVGRHLAQYPEVGYITNMRGWRPAIDIKEAHFFEEGFYADSTFFNVFRYPLLEGDPATALREPFTLVLSAALKEKYFGKDNALGKTLMIGDSVPYKITGVMAPLSDASHLRFDIVGAAVTVRSQYPEAYERDIQSGWFNHNMYTYVRLTPNATLAAFEARIKDLVLTAGKEEVASSGYKATLRLRPLQDIYLYSGMATAGGTVGNIKTIRLFLFIGLFILLMACLNFINLSTARSLERAKEIGIQKVLGNNRPKLILQFLMEAALLCILAAIISMVVMVLLLPFFNAFAEKTFTIGTLLSPGNMLLLATILLIVIPLAGFYPALVLSSFKPIAVLKGSFARSASGTLFRKSLVVTQFLISAGFIMCTLVMWKQMKHLQQQDLGFDKNKVLIADITKIPWNIRQQKTELFKSVLLSKNGFSKVTASTATPGRTGAPDQLAFPEGRAQDQGSLVEYIGGDEDFLNTMGIHLIAGRDILPYSAADKKTAFIINETAVKTLGFVNPKNAINKKLYASGRYGYVAGVVKDYHQHGLQDLINPIVISPAQIPNVFALRYDHIPASQAVATLNETAKEIFKGYSVEYMFMDEDFQQQYNKEEKLQLFVTIAAVLAIIIGSLGLLGLITYTAQKRVKEIGVRKVLGADVSQIVTLLSIDLLKLIAVAILLALPIAFWTMKEWLQNFAYRIQMHWSLFAIAALCVLVIAFVTISLQAVKAALANPIKSLRNE